MLNYTLGSIDAVGLILAIIALVMSIKLVIRTEKELDLAAKCLLAIAIVIALSNFTSINNFFGGIIPGDLGRIIFHASGIVVLGFLISAVYFLIKITKK